MIAAQILCALIFFILSLIAVMYDRAKERKVGEYLARRYDGKLTMIDGMLGSSIRKFSGKNRKRPFDLTLRHSDEIKYYYFAFQPKGAFPRMTITPRPMSLKEIESLGSNNSQATTRLSLKEKYVITGHSKAIKGLQRNPKFERRLDSVFQRYVLSVTCERNVVMVEAVSVPFNSRRVSELIERVSDLLELLDDCVDLNFRSTARSQLQKDTVNCPYCRDSIDHKKEEVVVCDTCGTEQHTECFRETEECATFGCNGTLRPRRNKQSPVQQLA